MRIKIPSADADAVYHCMSRIVGGQRLLDPASKEVFRRQLWQVADYCGLSILTYAILDNHFHILVKVPKKTPVSDTELLRRYHVLYPKPTAYKTEYLRIITAQLKTGGPAAVLWRKRQFALMGDISVFMKILKHRFTIWFNKTHQRFGTIWAERFNSVLVEPNSRAVQIMAAYIDLNPVRAGLASDPKDYRFCGYSEAVSGNKSAQSGIAIATLSQYGHAWREIHSGYRQILVSTGAAPRASKHSIPEDIYEKTMAHDGQLPLAEALKCRIRYFSAGAILGSKVFVATQLAAYRKHTGKRKTTPPRPLPFSGELGTLTSMRGLSKRTPN